jgi:hypothetical protein
VKQGGELLLLTFLCYLPPTVQSWDMRFPLCVGCMCDGTMFSFVCALPSTASAEGSPSLFGWFTGVGSEVAYRVSPMLATVRRSNRTFSFPAHGFHEDSRFRDAIEGIN